MTIFRHSGPTAARESTVLDTVVTRTAGLPLEAARRLRSPELASHLRALKDLRARLEEEKPGFSDLVHEVVPGADTHERRALLRMRRDIHNRRVPRRADVDVAERLLSEVPAALNTVRGTVAVTEELAEATDLLQDLVRRASWQGGCALADALGEPALARGLSLVSPEAARALSRAGARDLRSPGNKRSRTALAYTVRTALKPSPLSTLTSLRVDHAGAEDGARGTAVTATARLSEAPVLSVLHAALLHEPSRVRLRLRPNRSLRELEDGPRMLVPMFQHLNSAFFWRRDDVVDVSEVLGVLRALERVPTDADDTAPVEDFARALPPGWTLRRVLESQLLVPVTPWAGPHEDALSSLADTLTGVAAVDGAECTPAEYLRRAVREAGAVPELTARERVGARHRISTHLRGAFNALGTSAPAHVDHREVLYEDVAGPGAATPLPSGVRAAAETASGVLSGALFRSSLHDFVLDAVRAEVGVEQGPFVVDDVMALLHGISRGNDAVVRFQTSAMHDSRLIARAAEEGLPAPRRPVAASPSTADPTAFAVLQQSSGGVVLDQALLSGPGQLARYRHLPGGDRLEQDLRERFGQQRGVRAVEVVTAADQNGLQRASSDVLPRLQWPVESQTSRVAGGLHLSDLRLCVDGDDRVLITDGDGTPVVLRYAGVVPMTLISGPVRNLLALAHPWALARTSHEDFPEVIGPRPRASGTRVFPRASVGGLITGRRTVSCPPADCPLGDPDTDLPGLAADFDAWLADHGMPGEVFLRVAPGGTGFSRPAKPVWVAVDSPHSLEAARREASAQGVRELRLVEACPSSSDTAAVSEGHLVQHAHLMALNPNPEQLS